jgi:hypothetical protein
VKRGFLFNCQHDGAVTQYCATFADVQRVKLCPACTSAINDNQQDPRSIADTVSEACRLRDAKHAPSR